MACGSFWLILHVWYPAELATLAGGAALFGLLFGVDVVIGPALTAVIASPAKPLSALRRDMAVIVLLQLAAFSYGIYSIAVARPVFLAFEIDRIQILSQADIDNVSLQGAVPALRSLPWFGPLQISVVKPAGAEAQARSIEQGLAGHDLWTDASNWREFKGSSGKAWERARPVAVLTAHQPSVVDQLQAVARRAGQDPAALRFLPAVARRGAGVALIAAPDSKIVGYLMVDGFF